ncbi:MAG: anthranilate synthase component I family protein [Candidatus Zophobacter franzmannii]|nr:anthranilate synthase component I family protein [Candidatus Zophobacter franzmannii]
MLIKSYQIIEQKYQKAEECFQQYSSCQYSILLTGKGEKDIVNFSLIGVNPIAVFSLSPHESYKQTTNVKHKLKFTPWETLQKLIDTLSFETLPFPASKCGVCGFLSYELTHTIENLPKTTESHYKLPDALYVIYAKYYYFDEIKHQMWGISLEYDSSPLSLRKQIYSNQLEVGKIEPDFSKNAYCMKVEKVRDYIYSGDVYEVNLSQQFRAEFSGEPYQLFRNLYECNSAPFSAFIELPNLSIISLSPEQFLKVDGNRVETRPIKGTAPRFEDKIKDLESRNKLLNSEKDKAELHMIVDLLRNDISKCCDVGSVDVITPHRLEKYTNVWHLVAIIKGTLSNDKRYSDLIKGCFPGGSITGCPKVRSMEIIDELEVSTRNLYTGSIFVMNSQFIQSSIVIRTGIVATDIDTKKQTLYFNSGGAVTIDSDPESEYEEIIQKVSHFISTAGKE